MSNETIILHIVFADESLMDCVSFYRRIGGSSAGDVLQRTVDSSDRQTIRPTRRNFFILPILFVYIIFPCSQPPIYVCVDILSLCVVIRAVRFLIKAARVPDQILNGYPCTCSVITIKGYLTIKHVLYFTFDVIVRVLPVGKCDKVSVA